MLSPPRRARHLASTVDLREGSVEPVPAYRDRFRVFRVCDPTNIAEPDYGFCVTRPLGQGVIGRAGRWRLRWWQGSDIVLLEGPRSLTLY